MNNRGTLKRRLYRFGLTEVLAALCAVISIVALILGTTVKTTVTADLDYAVEYNSTGEYAYLDVEEIEDWTCMLDGKTYYTAYDESYVFNIALTDAEFAKMKASGIDNGDYTWSFNTPYRVVGLITDVEDEVIDLFVEAYSDMTEEDYYNYFGSTYLDGTVSLTGVSTSVYKVVALIAAMGAVMLAIISFGHIRNAGKAVEDLEDWQVTEAEGELKQLDDGKSKVIMGDNYLFSWNQPFVVRYADVDWVYPRTVKTNGIVTGQYLVLNTHSGKKLQIVSKDTELNNAIYARIQSANPEVLLGFTEENQMTYNQHLS